MWCSRCSACVLGLVCGVGSSSSLALDKSLVWYMYRSVCRHKVTIVASASLIAAPSRSCI
ncbi:hypothetical protein PF005_g9875 [Phytophthora fragariae]|uniref:Secreted protein n=1 Tax=Phytophthora fragariae TaxID=53985 RepID=A0A6A3SKS5_9STRA|nr:hypothetical protein PF003_g8645 [Phytophthora fragariae]KAE8939144.1 hypothetical protein PF009_g11008 [Phytophthora fragariae]KAE9013040.1 hypothetical protein PF011_g8648 [Phytophthora fragariae]KAE9115587.1 hypothetical protein PF007_g9966 [Phytophthora fragariae]KAE9115840.1 hypothetical protein PF010_g9174 [Phytophthora fragariae]